MGVCNRLGDLAELMLSGCIRDDVKGNNSA